MSELTPGPVDGNDGFYQLNHTRFASLVKDGGRQRINKNRGRSAVLNSVSELVCLIRSLDVT